MEDFFSSLIYILITIVIFIVSVIGKKKKATPVVPTGSPGQEQRETSVLSELFGEQYTQEVNNNQEIVDEFEIDEKDETPYSVEHDNQASTNTQRLEEQDFKSDGMDITHSEIKDADSEVFEEIESVFNVEDFDIEEAVIYSEILKRRYI